MNIIRVNERLEENGCLSIAVNTNCVLCLNDTIYHLCPNDVLFVKINNL